MSYKPNYDYITKGYNDALNVLSGGNFTPVKRKSERVSYGGINQPKSAFEQWNIEKTQPNRNASNFVGGGGGANVGWKWNTYPATANVDKSTDRGYNKVAEWDRSNYGDWDKSHTVTPILSGNSAGEKEDKPTSIYDSIHSDMKRYETQTPAYRPGEAGIKKPEKLFLSADEKKNVKFEQLPYKPDEHKGEYKLYSNNVQPTLNNASLTSARWDYYDMHLPEAEQELLESYLSEYARTSDYAVVTLPEGIEVNKKLYLNEQIMMLRRNIIPDKMLLFAQKDFETMDIDERNYKIVLGYDDYVTYDQALYEYAIDLYNSYQENGAYPYSTRNFDGSLNEYGKWLYNFAGRVSKRSGKEKASDAPSWVRWYTQQPGESAHDFATRILNDKFGVGNWKKGPGSDYNKIIKYIHRR